MRVVFLFILADVLACASSIAAEPSHNDARPKA